MNELLRATFIQELEWNPIWRVATLVWFIRCAIAHRSKSWFAVWCCSVNFSCVGRSADVVELLMHRLLAVYNVSYTAIGLANIIDHFIISPVFRSTVRKIGQLIWAMCFLVFFFCVCVTLLLGFCLSHIFVCFCCFDSLFVNQCYLVA